jgi:hypothetical protein
MACNQEVPMTKPQLPSPSQPQSELLTRRRVFAGVGAAGALAAVAAVLPLSPTPVPSIAAAAPKLIDDPDGRYQLTPHVQRYYQTAKL